MTDMNLGGYTMKKIIRIIALLCAASLLSGCSLIGDSEKTIKKKAEENAVVTVDGTAISKDRFNLYFYNEQDEMLQSAGITAASDIPEDFWTQKTDGKTNLDTVKENALASLIDDYLQYRKAVEEGIELTSDEKQSVSSQIAKMKQSQETVYQLEQVGISFDEYEQVLTESMYIQKLVDKYIDDGEIEVNSDDALEELKDSYVKAKHILISTRSDDGTDLSEEEIEKKKTEAEEILARINAGEDFDSLMNEYGEDPGAKSQPDGYLFTTGQMVQEFEDAAFALAENQVSGIVKSDYGYHIIKRVPFDTEGSQEQTFIENYKYSAASPEMEKLTKKWKAAAKIKINDSVYDNIEPTIVNNN